MLLAAEGDLGAGVDLQLHGRGGGDGCLLAEGPDGLKLIAAAHLTLHAQRAVGEVVGSTDGEREWGGSEVGEEESSVVEAHVAEEVRGADLLADGRDQLISHPFLHVVHTPMKLLNDAEEVEEEAHIPPLPRPKEAFPCPKLLLSSSEGGGELLLVPLKHEVEVVGREERLRSICAGPVLLLVSDEEEGVHRDERLVPVQKLRDMLGGARHQPCRTCERGEVVAHVLAPGAEVGG
mmetsp:Transcript_3467/g.8468  ORF Transcript_3467/g.8468 Transcript_3467/m.8468 type:complete len:235 (+) Transcript_3467:1638-2342(+)